MKQKINIAELLKDCPSGMELDCTMWDNATFAFVSDDNYYPITIRTPDGQVSLNRYGCYSNSKHAKCVIFPKDKNTWEGFQRPFKDGDIIHVCDEYGGVTFNYVVILKQIKEEQIYCYCFYSCKDDVFGTCDFLYNNYNIRFAIEEEKQKLFQAIKDNGYCWNPETKTLDKLPKFKVGDRIAKKNSACVPLVITGVSDDYYSCNTENSIKVLPVADQDDWELVKYNIKVRFKNGDKIRHKTTGCEYTIVEIGYNQENQEVMIVEHTTDRHTTFFKFYDIDNYELVPNKFDPTTLKSFDKVLVRHNKDNKWRGSFFSHIDGDLYYHCYKYVTIGGKSYPMCIPYEGNEHLSGTTNDCNEYYKNW